MERRGGGYRDNKRDRPPSFDRDRGGGGGGFRDNKRQRGPEIRFPESGPIALYANYFNLSIEQKTTKNVVKFQPEVESLPFRRRLLANISDQIGPFIYDGTTLVLQKMLGPENVTLRIETRSRDDTEYFIEITPLCYIEDDAREIRWLQNVIFRKMLRTLNLSQIGRHYYEDTKRIDLGRSHELWPGFIAAINEYSGGLFLNTDVTFKLLHKESIYQVIKQSRNQDQIRHSLIGKVLMTKYNKKTYRIKDVDFRKNPKETFLKNGKEISFEEYYQAVYNEKIHDPTQPLIIATVRRKGFEDQDVSLIPELCFLTGIDDEMRSNFQFMKSLHEQTSKDPHTRMGVLTSFVENFSVPKGIRDTKLLKEIDSWKFSINPTPLLITGRVSSERVVHFAQGETYMMESPGDWTNFFRNPKLRFHEQKSLTTNQGNWIIVYERNTYRTVEEFIRNFKEVSEKLGLGGNKPDLHEISNDRPESYVAKIKDVCQDTKNKIPLVVCILNSKQASRYEAIKRLLTIEIPIPSQCIVATTLQNAKGLKSVCTKIAQQVNSKLGGRLWAIGEQLPVPAMIVGIDVTHKRSSNTSIAGFCASMDSWCGNWYSRALFQSSNDQSIVDGLNMCMRDALNTFKMKNGLFPHAVIIYRDGVGDSQIQTLLETEIEHLKNAIRVVYGENELPRFQVILVQKKINARFFYSEDKNRPFYHNPPPGTVVDNTITTNHKSVEMSEFFLISQKVNKGAVSPTRYVVIANLNGIPNDLLQDLTFKLCHLYYNWSATISVPAPIQYANKLANLVSQAIKATPDDSLSNYLYFL